MQHLRNISTLILLALSMLSAQAQCDFTMTPNPACGSSLVKLQVVNPDSSFEYNFRFSSGLTKATGDSVAVYFPGTTSNQTYTVSLYKGNQLCQQTPPSRKTITIESAPDATGLTDISASSSKPFTFCNSTTSNPNYAMRIKNNSATKSINTKYTIDWGDGTPKEIFGSTFDEAPHTYKQQGYFMLKMTVEAPGLSCPSSTVEYSIFNGNIPAGGISSNGNTVGGCAPRSYLFNIENAQNNSNGTTYTVYLNKGKIGQYNNPPPANFWVDFEDHSCGKKGPNNFPNSHLLELEIANQCFTYKVSTSPIVLSSKPLANFSYNDEICINQPITFNNTTIGATVQNTGECDKITKPRWDITPDTGWTLLKGCMNGCESITIDFHSPGPWDVEIYLTNPCGEDSITKTITLKPAPIADANATITNPGDCAPTEVLFTNLSQTTNPNYTWSTTPVSGAVFIGGTTKNSANPNIRFTKAGNYTVQLKIPSSCGDAIWDTVIAVNGPPNINLPTITDQCNAFLYTPNASIQTGTNPLSSVQWTFSGGSPLDYTGLGTPPDVQYAAPGIYTVSLTATNACGTDIADRSFSILALGAINAGPDDSYCEGVEEIALLGTPLGGFWSGDGVVNGIFYPEVAGTGTHHLKYLISLQLCSDSAIRTITVDAKPIANGGDTLRLCRNALPTQLSGATPVGGIWSGVGVNSLQGIIDPSLSLKDTFNIQYIYAESVSGCADTAEKTIVILPTTSFLLDTVTLCLNKSAALIDFVENNSQIATGSWDFGDGNSSNNATGLHAYAAFGLYQVTFSSINVNGCPSVSTIWVKVTPAPTLSITKTAAPCNGGRVTFTSSTNLSATYKWLFGQGGTSTSAQPSPVLFPAGRYYDTTYYVQLTAYYACDSVVVRDSVKVKRTPVANIGVSELSGCTPFTSSFFNKTTGSPDYFEWDLGNGTTWVGITPPAQTYENNTAGNKPFTIRLIVGNSCGRDTAYKTITVKPKDAVAHIGADPIAGCPPLLATFTSYSTPGAALLWNFGNGQTATGISAQHTFNQSGNYSVQLIARTACSADTTTTDITVYPSPQLSFTTENTCQGQTVKFQNTSTDADAFWWEFGNGFVSPFKNPSYQYPQPGQYTISMSGENQWQCRDTISKGITIYSQPDALFDIPDKEFCQGTPLLPNNTSTLADTYIWDFGDGSTSTEASPNKMYDEPGIYAITLIAGKSGACFDTLKKSYAVEVLPSPEAAFTYYIATGLESGTVVFSNNSINANEFLWNFGDGDLSTSYSPDHTYASGGQKLVSLLAINLSGCRDSTEEVINFKSEGEIYLPNAFAPISAQGIDAGLFRPKGFGLRAYRAEVYSTWGELLWVSEKLDNGQPVEGWDGRYKGQLMPQDSYIWKITATLKDGSPWEGNLDPDGQRRSMGVVMLLR